MSQHDQFTPFPRLPKELRLMVWDWALLETEQYMFGIEEWGLFHKAPAITAVCQESRKQVFKTSQMVYIPDGKEGIPVWFSPRSHPLAADTLYLEGDDWSPSQRIDIFNPLAQTLCVYQDTWVPCFDAFKDSSSVSPSTIQDIVRGNFPRANAVFFEVGALQNRYEAHYWVWRDQWWGGDESEFHAEVWPALKLVRHPNCIAFLVNKFRTTSFYWMDCSHAGNKQERPEGDKKELSGDNDDEHDDYDDTLFSPDEMFSFVLARAREHVRRKWEAEGKPQVMSVFEGELKSLYKEENDGLEPTDKWVQHKLQGLPKIQPALTVRKGFAADKPHIAPKLKRHATSWSG